MINKSQYQIILLKNNERIETLCTFSLLTSVLIKYNELLEENKKIILPIKKLNIEKIEDVKYHLCIIKRKDENDLTNPKFKNDFGEFIENIVEDNDEWIIFKKEEYFIEEKFWVYGFHPLYDRKNFMFIYNDILKDNIKSKYDFINIYYYKNKIIFEGVNTINMVICKDMSDAVRLYCKLDDFAKEDKLKYLAFTGNGGRTKKSASMTIDKIMSFTNWDRRKIKRSTT